MTDPPAWSRFIDWSEVYLAARESGAQTGGEMDAAVKRILDETAQSLSSLTQADWQDISLHYPDYPASEE